MDVNYTVCGGLWELAAQAKIDLVRRVWECKHMTKRVNGEWNRQLIRMYSVIGL